MSNIAVIGAGYWGKNLIRNVNELGFLHYVCDSTENNPKLKKKENIWRVLRTKL